jgi:uncharacterized protein
MKVTPYTLAVEQVAHTLQQALTLLDKGIAHAEAKKFDSAVLVGSRLAPDMLPLSKQVQILSDTAKFGVARLTGLEAPKFEDTEKTMDELKARLTKTIDYVKSAAATAFEGAEDRDVQIKLPNRTLDMKGLTYLRGWLLPNFYFHVSMLYAILRHNGVDIGKRDFLGELN